jgi:hypothetical protein
VNELTLVVCIQLIKNSWNWRFSRISFHQGPLVFQLTIYRPIAKYIIYPPVILAQGHLMATLSDTTEKLDHLANVKT